MIQNTAQRWEVGEVVKVGFLTLRVAAKVPTPRNWDPHGSVNPDGGARNKVARFSEHSCKSHGYAHRYVVCVCGCHYCDKHWKSCPRCIGAHPSNTFAEARHD